LLQSLDPVTAAKFIERQRSLMISDNKRLDKMLDPASDNELRPPTKENSVHFDINAANLEGL
jgi:hypothetical protein